LKLLRPELGFELVEPKNKRVTFLRTAVSTLGMTGIEIRRQRAEEVAGQGFDVALSRATFSPEIWLPEGARVARRAVWVLLAQGEAPSSVQWRVESTTQYRWPLTGVSRRALCYVRAE
jgi:16S rRNA (guanine527-N7)-methyltransferase